MLTILKIRNLIKYIYPNLIKESEKGTYTELIKKQKVIMKMKVQKTLTSMALYTIILRHR